MLGLKLAKPTCKFRKMEDMHENFRVVPNRNHSSSLRSFQMKAMGQSHWAVAVGISLGQPQCQFRAWPFSSSKKQGLSQMFTVAGGPSHVHRFCGLVTTPVFWVDDLPPQKSHWNHQGYNPPKRFVGCSPPSSWWDNCFCNEMVFWVCGLKSTWNQVELIHEFCRWSPCLLLGSLGNTCVPAGAKWINLHLGCLTPQLVGSKSAKPFHWCQITSPQLVYPGNPNLVA